MQMIIHLFAALVLLLLATLRVFAAPAVDAPSLAFDLPEVGLTPEGWSYVTLSHCEPDVRTGKPVLPFRVLSLPLPPGTEVVSLHLAHSDVGEIQLAAPPLWGQPARSPGAPPHAPAARDPAIYDGQMPYPDAGTPLWRVDQTDGRPLLSVTIHPVRYDPTRQLLLAARRVAVVFELRERVPDRRVPLSPPLPLPPGDHDYLVISTADLIDNTPGPWNLQSLCAARAADGFTTGIVDVAWIVNQYEGANTPERIRSFLQDAHAQWGTRYLLLAGTFETLPAQRLYVKFTDFIFTREAEIPADAIYYGCLDGPFDANGNGRYGEVTDGLDNKDVDLTAEIMVGRFPVATPAELAHMVRKTLRHADATPAETARHAFLAERVDLGNTAYATGFLEELRHGSSTYSLDSLGYTAPPFDTLFNEHLLLYDSDDYRWSGADSLALLESGPLTLHHLGHGAVKTGLKLNLANAATRQSVAELINDVPGFIYSQACLVGAFDTPDCFAEQIVTASNALAAAVMNAREGWEYPSVVGGYSHRYHRAFIDAALRGKAATYGAINEQSRRMNLAQLDPKGANYWRWVHYELNLFGDPALPFARALNPMPAEITHTPLLNTFETNAAYEISCALEPIGLYLPARTTLLWRDADQPAQIQTQAMPRTSGNIHAASIPPHPAGTTLEYAITATTHAGIETRWPEQDGWWSFRITQRLALYVFGSPDALDSVTPPYGVNYYADDYPVMAAAPLTTPDGEGSRYLCTGFSGNGNIPQYGSSNSLALRTSPSTTVLLWNWQRQHRLIVPSSGITNWCDEGSSHPLVTTPAISGDDTNQLVFAHWLLDGVRLPAAPAESSITAPPIVADTPHTLNALYLPAELDADNNGLADWWELRYYGATGQDPDADDDDDGYTLAQEFADRTNPLDPESIPAPPVIVHQPLAELQQRPGPFTISAIITDTHLVVNPQVVWRRALEPWQNTPLDLQTNDTYSAEIALETRPGEDYEYYILASDPDGRTTLTDTHFFWLAYPEADTARLHDLDALATAATQPPLAVQMDLHNTGNATLEWSLDYGIAQEFSTPLPHTWGLSHEPEANSDWQLSTNRFVSAPSSIHSALTSAHSAYTPNIANLTTPPIELGEHASLDFSYWIQAETPKNSTNLTWDGGIVEISTNGGASFAWLPGPYTHTMTNWNASPWPADTPCFSGDGDEGWRDAHFDLSAYRFQIVQLRFSHGGDNNTNLEGWYLDDLRLATGIRPLGFAHSLPHDGPFQTAAGGMQRILWSATPALMAQRDAATTVFLRSNDPLAPLFTFNWTYRLRDLPPALHAFSSAQATNGTGTLSLELAYTNPDPDDVLMSLEWSQDGQLTWQPVEPEAHAGGAVITNAPIVAATNTLPLLWQSRPQISATTQLYFRVAADNSFHAVTNVFGPFTVDNVAPLFAPGAIDFYPTNSWGHVVAAEGAFSISWPQACDNLPGPVHYTLSQQAPGVTDIARVVSVATNFSALADTPAVLLDVTNAFRITACDHWGNSNSLASVVLVLDPETDYDGDGFTTGEEFAHNWDPTAFTCPLFLESREGAQLTLMVPTVTGRAYTIEASPTLAPPAWQPLSGYVELPGSGTPLLVPLVQDAPSMFFRVLVR